MAVEAIDLIPRGHVSDTVERTSNSQTSHAGQRPAAAASGSEPRPALGPVLALIQERVPAERRETVAAFAKAYLRRLADDEIAAAPAEDLYGLVRSTFDFVDGRRLHPWVVRVFHPDAATDGFTSSGSILETNVDDSPFLVDSVTEELTTRSLVVRRILHPVIGTSRDEEGWLERISSARDASHRESVMHFELDRRLSDTMQADLEESVKTILHDVRLVVRDFEPMQDRAHHMLELARHAAVRYSPQEVGETVDFLDWLLQLNFVFLGYREYELLDTPDGRAIRAVPGSGLGILSDVGRSTFSETTLLDSLDPGLRRRIEDGDLLVFSKTNAYSTVHRRARMDYIGVRRVNAEGEIVGEARMIGLFTSKAYMEPAAKTPLLHHKLEQVLTAEDLIPGSHDYKAATTLFESFPKDELFQASTGELRRLISGLLQLERHGGIRVLVRRDLYGRSISIVVALPRDRFNADLRKSLQRLFKERFHGSTVDYHLSLGETENARIFFTVHVDPGRADPRGPLRGARAGGRTARAQLGRRPQRLAGRPRRAPIAARRSPTGMRPGSPTTTSRTATGTLIVDDVLKLDELEQNDEGFVVGLGNEPTGERLTRVKLYKTGGKVDLSAFMPILETLGLRVVEEVPTGLLGDGKVYIHDFGVLDSRGAVLDLETQRRPGRGDHRRGVARPRRVRLAEPPGRDGRAHMGAGGHPPRVPEVSSAHLHQVHGGVPERRARREPGDRLRSSSTTSRPASIPTVRRPMTRWRRSARTSCRTFARSRRSTRIRSSATCSARSGPACGRMRIGRSGSRCRSSCARRRYPRCRSPSPCSRSSCTRPEMEAIHLRRAMVARGGIRWSDRREDYRTEVLGLMKAQMVKNAIIVPDGSKGGFILKRNPRRARPAEGGGHQAVRHVHARIARYHRQPRSGARRASRTGPGARRRRHLPGRGRRQGDGDVLRHGERRGRGIRVLVGRRVRVREGAPASTTRRSGSPHGAHGSR